MGIFSKLKVVFVATPPAQTVAQVTSGGNSSWRVLLTELGVTTPSCPHCGYSFDRMPQRKRSCPQCNGVFYSQKRALDGAKVLLTEEQAREGEAQNALLTLVQFSGLKEADFNELLRTLGGRFGRIPTADEVVSQHLVESASTNAEAWNWGLYRNARFGLAESCARRGLTEDALRHFLDLNGPRNLGTRDPQIARRYPPFDPSTADLAPGVVSRTVDLMAELNLKLDDVRRVFETLASSVGRKLGLPRPTADAWHQLSAALAGIQR